eukprot:Em0006g1398a
MIGIKVKEMDNNERKQSDFSMKEPIELDAEKRQLFFRKAFSCAVVIIICTTTSVAWMVGPLVAFNKPREPTDNTCSLQPYKGTVCRDVLENSTLCVVVADVHTFGSSSSLQYLMEVNASQQLRSALKNDTKYMMPYICWSAFNVTMQVTNGVDAPKSPELCKNDTVPSGVEYINNNKTLCSKLFYYDSTSGLCRPTCGVQIGSENKSITDVLLLFGIFGCIVAFVASVFNHKVMQKFPSILLIYWLVSGVAYFITDIVECCTTKDYFENSINPSLPCQLKAFVSIFLGYLLAIFPLEHTLILFSGVWFPYMSKNIFSSTRKRLYLHAFAVLMAFIAPCAVCAGLIAAYMNGSVTDVVQFYYSFVPLYGVYGVIAALVGLTVWKLMGRESQTADRLRCSKCCTPELKLAAVFIYVVILFGATVVQHVLETYRTYGYVDDYFLCESLGTNVCTLDPDHFNGAINAFTIFSTLVFSLSPYMSLIYIMPVHLMRQKVKRWRSKSTVVTA